MPNRDCETDQAGSPASVAASALSRPRIGALPAAPTPGTGHFRTPIAAVIQRARANPRSLTRADVAQLHRSLGNAAVERLLMGAALNRTGLPDGLKARAEAMSGLPMDDVRVRYNSSKPAELQAHAYAQGTDIHLAPGQERHLPHEVWHVVQQKQGRVRATSQIGRDVGLNDDPRLESEADGAGTRMYAQMTRETAPSSMSVVSREMDRSARVAQLVGYPADSTGTIDHDVEIGTGGSATKTVNGKSLQSAIITAAQKLDEDRLDGQKKGGFRLGSYILDEKGALSRKPDDVAKGPGEEDHGMEYLTEVERKRTDVTAHGAELPLRLARRSARLAG